MFNMYDDQLVPDVTDIPSDVAVHVTDGTWMETDPPNWSRDDVRQWLSCVKLNNNLEVDVDILPMNGKGLCLISQETFKKHIPLGGEVLFRDLLTRIRYSRP